MGDPKRVALDAEGDLLLRRRAGTQMATEAIPDIPSGMEASLLPYLRSHRGLTGAWGRGFADLAGATDDDDR